MHDRDTVQSTVTEKVLRDVTNCTEGRPDAVSPTCCLPWLVGCSQLGMYSGHFIGHQLQGRSPGEKLLAQDWPALLGSHCLICCLCQAEVSSSCLHGPVSTE